MVQFIGWQPFRQQRMQSAATRLEGAKPNRFQDRQQALRVVGPGPTQCQVELRGYVLGLRLTQSTDGRLAMVAQQFDDLVEEFDFVLLTGRSVSPPQPG